MSTGIGMKKLNAHTANGHAYKQWVRQCVRGAPHHADCMLSFIFISRMINVCNGVASAIRHYPIRITIHHICVNERPRRQHEFKKEK